MKLQKKFIMKTTKNVDSISLLLQGCFTLVTTAMESNLGIIAGISFGIAFFQVKETLFYLWLNSKAPAYMK